MNQKVIITIARQYGSGGREIGKQLAEQLQIPFYDKELLKLAAKESGIAEDLFESADEKPTNSFWDTMSIGTSTLGGHFAGADLPMNDQLFLIQSDIIKKVAATGSCVIVGRCADYILEEDPHAVHVFVHASPEEKLKRIVDIYGAAAEKAKEIMTKTDRKRATYYNYYANGKWGRAENYDLALDSSAVGIAGAVTTIKTFAGLKLNIDLNA